MNREVICFDAVAPARERGLKSAEAEKAEDAKNGRSREGAWIEIDRLSGVTEDVLSRSREGAWIEITKFDMYWPTFASLPRGSVD